MANPEIRRLSGLKQLDLKPLDILLWVWLQLKVNQYSKSLQTDTYELTSIMGDLRRGYQPKLASVDLAIRRLEKAGLIKSVYCNGFIYLTVLKHA